MLAKIYSAAAYGVEAYEVEIEVNSGQGQVDIVIGTHSLLGKNVTFERSVCALNGLYM